VRELEALASKLGLRFEHAGMVPGARLHGVLDGVGVDLIANPSSITTRGWFSTPLDLGLSIVAHVPFAPAFRNRVTVGEDSWDLEIDAYADEPDRGRALLCDELRSIVTQCNIGDPLFRIDDRHVELHGFAFDAEVFLRRVAAVGAAVEAARREVPVAMPLARCAEAWSAVARARNLDWQSTPLGIRGATDGLGLDVSTLRRSRGGHDVGIRLRVLEPAMVPKLRIRRETTADRVRAFFMRGEVQIGDDAFDRAFLIDCLDADLARRVLSPPVCAQLVELCARFEAVELSGAALSLSGDAAAVQPADLDRALTLGAALAESIANAAAESRGPYR